MLRTVLKRLTKNVMKKNKFFNELHRGEECYIFGNGDSLKYFDLELFKDKISFGCNVLMVHKDFHKLYQKYYVSVHPLIYSPVWQGMQSGIYFEKNPYYKLYKKYYNCNHINFVHSSNYFFINDKNKFRFVHNLDKYPIGTDYIDFTTSCSFVHAALSTMVGLAIYMGFKKVYLVGCDYLFTPMVLGHFWDVKEARLAEAPYPHLDLLNKLSDVIDLTIVTRKGISSKIKSIQYEKFFNVKENYKNADQLVSQSDLKELEKTLYTRK